MLRYVVCYYKSTVLFVCEKKNNEQTGCDTYCKYTAVLQNFVRISAKI